MIDENVTIAERVTILTHLNVGYEGHPLQKYFPSKSLPTFLAEGCFIGTNSTILCGVNIGKFSFVAAGSLVNKDVPDKTLVGGVPAKVIKSIEMS